MSIGDDLFALAGPGGRKPGTAGHAEARALILRRLTDLGLRPLPPADSLEQISTGDGVTVHNVIGVIPGTEPGLAPLLLGAHYDSAIPAPSADDNAAGVAAMLSAAAALAAGPALRRDMVVAAFDTEEPPYFLSPAMGSERFVSGAMDDRGVALAVILDLIGHPMSLPGVPLDPHVVFVVGAETHPALPGALEKLDLPAVATRWERVGDFSDYAAFRRAGVPWLFFSCGEWPDYHTARDTPDKVDIGKVERVAAALVDLLRDLDGADLGGAQDHDTTGFEIATLRARLGGAVLGEAAALVGLSGVTSRADLDVLIPELRALAYFGR